MVDEFACNKPDEERFPGRPMLCWLKKYRSPSSCLGVS